MDRQYNNSYKLMLGSILTTAYITQRHSYPVELINDIPVIRASFGQTKGQPYVILGCYDPNRIHLVCNSDGTEFTLNPRESSNERITVPLDDLANHLDQEIKTGSRIIARHIKINGEFAPLSPFITIITGRIQRIE